MSVKASFSALSGLAFSALLGAAVLAGCGGGGTSNSVPTTTTPTSQTPTNGSASIGSLNLNQPASSVAINLTNTTPAGPTVDVKDAATVAVDSSAAVGMPSFTDVSQHTFKGSLTVGPSSSSAHRAARDVAVNSPYDLSYFGGPVLGSVVSHDLFLNCQANCRQGEGFFPGVFLADLNQDQFVTLLYQYRTSPGVTLGSPVGSYTKGPGGDLTATYASPRPGSSNPYFGELAIWLQVLNAAGAPGHPTSLGGGGLAHVYHVFLPKNVDTCMENPPGTPTTSCYSPDNGSTFFFCAYHGAFTATSGNQRQTYLFTVEPYQDVGGCRNLVGNQPQPNAVSPGVDPADPGYSTLSHELFETISDPLGNAWFNGLTGNEIADLCASFDNFVTVNGHPYVLESEYSDIRHLCVSANLTNSSNNSNL
jgi:hypothetical protein